MTINNKFHRNIISLSSTMFVFSRRRMTAELYVAITFEIIFIEHYVIVDESPPWNRVWKWSSDRGYNSLLFCAITSISYWDSITVKYCCLAGAFLSRIRESSQRIKIYVCLQNHKKLFSYSAGVKNIQNLIATRDARREMEFRCCLVERDFSRFWFLLSIKHDFVFVFN